MNTDLYDNTAIERTCESAFGVRLTVLEVVARKLPTGFASTATVFKTANPAALYVMISSQTSVVLADVQKMVRSMNADADEYLPPHGDADYFSRIATQKFKSMFPGKHITSPDDLRYYRTLAPYNPALVRLSKVKGDIRAFHYESKSWRKVKDYAYSKITLVQ